MTATRQHSQPHRASPAWMAAVAPDRHDVAAAGRELALLERRLRNGDRVDVAGGAMLRRLLTDRTRHIYDPVGAGLPPRHWRTVAGALEAQIV